MSAVSAGDKQGVSQLLSMEINPNTCLPQVNSYSYISNFAIYNKTLCLNVQTHSTPLMEASRIGNVEIAQLLLNKGKAQPDLPNEVL